MVSVCFRWANLWRVLLSVFAVNLISHPLAWHAHTLFGPESYWPLEVLVVGFESIALGWLIPISVQRAVLLSVLANAATIFTGWLLVSLG